MFDYVGCGDVIATSNKGAASNFGNPSGDKLYLFVAFEEYMIEATTCSDKTTINTRA